MYINGRTIVVSLWQQTLGLQGAGNTSGWIFWRDHDKGTKEEGRDRLDGKKSQENLGIKGKRVSRHLFFFRG